uniref:Uncharacterized protein LOC111100182 n=1 Tax=Crassostrea virginica TaxID=6565 RepID=A0A8B8AAI3_CRAVI|nr:uncharacterized protein LOC111100182 [Crassostrea virginica]
METLMLQILLGYFFIIPVKSFLLPNIALGKDAYQSKTYNSHTGPEKAVDGMKSDLSHTGGQCALSGSFLKNATWRVDLGDISSVKHITIYYRTDNKTWVGACFGQYYYGTTTEAPATLSAGVIAGIVIGVFMSIFFCCLCICCCFGAAPVAVAS